eukprot:CAMPEP_0184671780 /NCGR_PEP_ID=MMETSP0308-20130426/85704_1 /TAXON_ID=38269 /ORGANISM="Gloeochaete witrockiana, Strain SAG 46.84" /LENGTH=228 /DNA_ID=CAMNT_0027118971 /DNA_START=40 /DNA_END=726 /DNA_ORIENTATION=+
MATPAFSVASCNSSLFRTAHPVSPFLRNSFSSTPYKKISTRREQAVADRAVSVFKCEAVSSSTVNRRQFLAAVSIACASTKVEAASLPLELTDLSKIPESKFTTTESGLKIYDVKVGKGPIPEVGQTIVLHYKGYLPKGQTVLNTREGEGRPAQYRFGVGGVLKGIDEGVSTMRVGGSRRIIVPPELGFGSKSVKASPGKPAIPPNTTLVFDIDLLLIPGTYDADDEE